ncbi:MAG TPA: hypothetical protein VK206_14530 [Anaerolineales bacterium]|nr:hypothetical protein [Anaerolineales bacterium]
MKTAKIVKMIGLLPIGFISLVSLIFGIGESAGGDLGALMHLVPFVIMGLAMWLCWKLPLWGGVLLLAFALFRILALVPEFFLRPPGSIWNFGLFLLILIPAISGGLFLYAGLLKRRAVSLNLP